jgi:hypothetical protein
MFNRCHYKHAVSCAIKFLRGWLIDWLIMWGVTDVSEQRPSLAYCSYPGWMWAWWWWCRLGITPDSSTRALWHSYQQRYLGQEGGMDEGVRISRVKYLWYFNGSFACRKILRLGISGFTSHPNEGVLRIFIALKNPSPRPGFNPQPLGPVASTITTTPPRRPFAVISD